MPPQDANPTPSFGGFGIRHDGNPIVRPWEVGGNGTYGFGGTVFYDEEDRIFKMWYRVDEPLVRGSDDRGHDPPGSYRACYAISNDGATWEKPELGLYEFEGSTRNNIIPPSTDGMKYVRRPNLIKDYDEPDPNRRYKPTFPRSAAWVRRNPVRVLPI